MEFLPLLTALIGAAGSYALFNQKQATDRTKLATDQYSNASEMVKAYVNDLHDLGERVEQLQRGLINANNELATLRAENAQFRQQIQHLEAENLRLNNEVARYKNREDHKDYK